LQLGNHYEIELIVHQFFMIALPPGQWSHMLFFSQQIIYQIGVPT